MNLIGKKKRGRGLGMVLVSISIFQYFLVFFPAGTEIIEASLEKLKVDIEETMRQCELSCDLQLPTALKQEVVCLLGTPACLFPTSCPISGLGGEKQPTCLECAHD